jgi:hypothetical protein
MGNVLAGGGLAAIAGIALVLGPGPFAVALTVLAALVLVDAGGLLARAEARPILPVALIPGLGMPVLAALRPRAAWEALPLLVAGAFAAAFLLALVFGRRKGIAHAVGATLVVGLVVGLGSGSLLLLRALPHGFRWVLAFGLIAAAADLGGPLHAALARRTQGGRAVRAEVDLLGPVLAAAGSALALGVLLRPPLVAPVVALLALVALTAALGTADLHRALVADAHAAPVGAASPRLGDGRLLAVVDGVLLGAPVAYLVARSAVL